MGWLAGIAWLFLWVAEAGMAVELDVELESSLQSYSGGPWEVMVRTESGYSLESMEGHYQESPEVRFFFHQVTPLENSRFKVSMQQEMHRFGQLVSGTLVLSKLVFTDESGDSVAYTPVGPVSRIRLIGEHHIAQLPDPGFQQLQLEGIAEDTGIASFIAHQRPPYMRWIPKVAWFRKLSSELVPMKINRVHSSGAEIRFEVDTFLLGAGQFELEEVKLAMGSRVATVSGLGARLELPGYSGQPLSQLRISTRAKDQRCYEHISAALCLRGRGSRECVRSGDLGEYATKLQNLHREFPTFLSNAFCSLKQIMIRESMSGYGAVIRTFEKPFPAEYFTGATLVLNKKIMDGEIKLREVLAEKHQPLAPEIVVGPHLEIPAYKYIIAHELGHIIQQASYNNAVAFTPEVSPWGAAWQQMLSYRQNLADSGAAYARYFLESPFLSPYAVTNELENFAEHVAFEYLQQLGLEPGIRILGVDYKLTGDHRPELLSQQIQRTADLLAGEYLFYP